MINLFNLYAAIEAGPQPNGVVRADIYNMVKEAWELTLEWIQLFNSGKKKLALTSNSPAASGCSVSRDKRQTSHAPAASFQQEAHLKKAKWKCTGQSDTLTIREILAMIKSLLLFTHSCRYNTDSLMISILTRALFLLIQLNSYWIGRIRTSSCSGKATRYSWLSLGRRWSTREMNSTRSSSTSVPTTRRELPSIWAGKSKWPCRHWGCSRCESWHQWHPALDH